MPLDEAGPRGRAIRALESARAPPAVHDYDSYWFEVVVFVPVLSVFFSCFLFLFLWPPAFEVNGSSTVVQPSVVAAVSAGPPCVCRCSGRILCLAEQVGCCVRPVVESAAVFSRHKLLWRNSWVPPEALSLSHTRYSLPYSSSSAELNSADGTTAHVQLTKTPLLSFSVGGGMTCRLGVGEPRVVA